MLDRRYRCASAHEAQGLLEARPFLEGLPLRGASLPAALSTR